MDLQDERQGQTYVSDKITIAPEWKSVRVDGITVAQGWECPRCKLINAPHVNACSCQSVAQFVSEMP